MPIPRQANISPPSARVPQPSARVLQTESRIDKFRKKYRVKRITSPKLADVGGSMPVVFPDEKPTTNRQRKMARRAFQKRPAAPAGYRMEYRGYLKVDSDPVAPLHLRSDWQFLDQMAAQEFHGRLYSNLSDREKVKLHELINTRNQEKSKR